jgi:hypothetical protein
MRYLRLEKGLADLGSRIGEPFLHDRFHVDFQEQMRASLKVKTEVDPRLRYPCR